jgi:hypothetical protein
MNKQTYYYFCGEDRKLRYGDNRPIVVGETLKVDCAPMLCEQGLHASKRLIDALSYAPGSILCKVKLGGTIVHGDDKSVATERTVIAMADCTDVLREFARKCALDVIHLWDAPDVVVECLKTGNESIRAAARAAAADAARNADAACAAAYAAAYAADAVSNAAYAAAADAARVASWHEACAAACAADVVSNTAWAAACAADVAADAVMDKQNRRLVAMISKANWETV